MSSPVEFRHLEYLVAIDEGKNFTRAAEKLYRSQPAISQQVRGLESDIEFPIFVRHGRDGVTPTPAGELVLGWARTVLEERNEIFAIARAIHRGEVPPLRLGFSSFVTQREAEHEQRMAEYRAKQERKEEERKAQFERQQKEHEAEQTRREKLHKARVATFERIIEEAPASFNPAQMRVFLRLLIHLDFSFLEEVATHFANGDENTQQSDDEIVLAALDGTADGKLSSFALRLVLSDHIGIPQESQPDLLTEAEQVFAPKKPKAVKARGDGSSKPKPTAVKASAKKETTKKKAA